MALELLGGSELDDFASELDDFGTGFELLDSGALLDDEGSILDDERISTWFEKKMFVIFERENELEELSLSVLSGTLIISILPEWGSSLCASATSLLQPATTVNNAANMYPLILVI
ncbi:hypothetical protein [Fibrobacter sp. UWB11]|uniref:hypothetical protein n=1 Tax=Fibrobacter sp. UWB11 TaxID=1896202 RepID=UPI000925CABE|nr:hypothetical protein [Fibrobacter sp. UWB11]SIO29599.1 hypothetical protein SAMN05720758_2071 [Fibrobacter sp. UWB11]